MNLNPLHKRFYIFENQQEVHVLTYEGRFSIVEQSFVADEKNSNLLKITS